MTKQRSSIGYVGMALLTMGFALQGLLPGTAQAAQISARSLTLQEGLTLMTTLPAANASQPTGVHGSTPGGFVRHRFDFNLPTNNKNVGAIKFQYCTTAADSSVVPSCVAPTGIDASQAELYSEGGVTGFSYVNDVVNLNQFYLTRTPAMSAGGIVHYTLNNIKNPTNINETFFVRITTYTTATPSALPADLVDSGTVAASTADPILLSGTMPESLVFCTGRTIGLNAVSSLPDCASPGTTAGTVVFDRLFSPTATAYATSQMAASTNAGNGYNITVNGPTLTSGTNTIAPMTALDVSQTSRSQFGLNLRANAAAGADVAPASVLNSTYKGQPSIPYSTVEQFKYTSGDSVAKSDYVDGNRANDALGGTDAQIYTVTYIANVPGSLPAGTYSTTLTYICTATY
jgi:hypothetical protein